MVQTWKFFSEKTFSKIIKATLLVAAPFDDINREESLADFKLTSPLLKFAEQGGMIYLIHSKDDSVVPFEQLAKYKMAIPKTETLTFDDREHFNQGIFPEIIELIKKL